MLGAEIIRFISPGDETTVLVTNLAPKSTEDDLFLVFRKFGPIYKRMSVSF